LIENRAARVALAGFHVELDHFHREILFRRVVRGAAAGRDAVLAAAVAVNGEQVARSRRLGGKFHRLDLWPPNHQRCKVPVLIDFERSRVRAESAREHDFHDALRIAHDVPIGHDEPELIADVD
jgi:hypothetical protein